MAPRQPSLSSSSLLTLPAEIQVEILAYLRPLDRLALGLINRHFHSMIHPPTHAELLLAEGFRPYGNYSSIHSPAQAEVKTGYESRVLLACVGCTRLRPMAAFSPNMVQKKKVPRGSQAHNRFCIECGRRPLQGLHRYMLGARWKELGVPFVRCIRCHLIATGPEDQAVKLCLSCHSQDLEKEESRRERTLKEAGAKSWQMVAEESSLRAERKQRWIERGGALSDFSEQDPEDEWDYDWDTDSY